MGEKTYLELLRDPKWQRKRLEILQRDDWTCQNCRATDKNLQVHHRRYFAGKKPWEYEGEHLVTLCEDYHFREGFELVAEDENDIFFRVQPGLLIDVNYEENNGARVFKERFGIPGFPSLANASVSQSVLMEDDRRTRIKVAIQHLIDNFKRPS